jgi:hypothetical protein
VDSRSWPTPSGPPARPTRTDEASRPAAIPWTIHSAAFTFTLICCVLGAVFSLFTVGRRPEKADSEKTHESVGEELAAVAAQASGEAPSELIAEPARR